MRYILIILSLTFSLSFCFFHYLDYNKKEEIENVLKRENEMLALSYEAVTTMYSITIRNYFKHFVMQAPILSLLQDAKIADQKEIPHIRGLLYRALYPFYEKELKSVGIRQFHFHTPTGESFLRFHVPSENGDSLIDIRPSIKIANVEKRNSVGFEGGRVYPGFRYVFPIIDKDVHLGSVELSLSFESIENELSKLIKSTDNTLLLKKEIASNLVYAQYKKFFSPSHISSSFVIENEALSSVTAKEMQSPMVKHINALLAKDSKVEQLLLEGKNFSYPLIDGKNGYITNFHAISDTSGNFAAYAVTYNEMDTLVHIQSKYKLFFVYGIIFILLFCATLLLLLRNRKNALSEKVRYETIIRKTINGIILIDTYGKINFINHAACTLLGYRYEEIIGEVLHSKIHHCSESESACAILNTITSQNTYIGEEFFYTKNGDTLNVSLNVTPFIENHITTGSMVIFRDITEEKKNKEIIEYLAYHDDLTDLPNRKLFLDRISLSLLHAKRNNQFNGVLFMDLDNFKVLNDSKGHNFGDILLQEVALRLKQGLRQNDTVARFGGDEFVILIVDLGTDNKLARIKLFDIATKLLEILSKEYHLITGSETILHHCGASIGGTLFDASQTNVHDILKVADSMMYDVKKSGKNAVKLA